jgi:hypothetical protein
MKIELTKSQIRNLIDFIELEFYGSIRRDTEIDNMDYAVDLMNVLQTLRDVYKDGNNV